MPTDVDLLTSLSDEELDALATSTLVPASQDRLDELLAKNAENELDDSGQAELECIVASALSRLEIGVVRHSRAGGNPDRGTGFPPARE